MRLTCTMPTLYHVVPAVHATNTQKTRRKWFSWSWEKNKLSLRKKCRKHVFVCSSWIWKYMLFSSVELYPHLAYSRIYKHTLMGQLVQRVLRRSTSPWGAGAEEEMVLFLFSVAESTRIIVIHQTKINGPLIPVPRDPGKSSNYICYASHSGKHNTQRIYILLLGIFQLHESHQSINQNTSDICATVNDCYVLQSPHSRHTAVMIVVAMPYYRRSTSIQHIGDVAVALQVVVLPIKTQKKT